MHTSLTYYLGSSSKSHRPVRVLAEHALREEAAGDPESAPSLLFGPGFAQDSAAGHGAQVPLLGHTAGPKIW